MTRKIHLTIIFIYLSVCVDVFFTSTNEVNIKDKDNKTDISDTDGACTLPNHPDNGEWQWNGKKTEVISVPNYAVVTLKCIPGYHQTAASIDCSDELWNINTVFPECKKICPPVNSTNIASVKCTDLTGNKIRCNESIADTFLEYSCVSFYEPPSGYSNILICGSNGKWDKNPLCQPICGKKIEDPTEKLIANRDGNPESPWVVAIYKKTNNSYDLVCSGSIVSRRIVLTDADCFGNVEDVLPVQNYLIGTGKLYSKYQSPEDRHAQYLKISGWDKEENTSSQVLRTANITYKNEEFCSPSESWMFQNLQQNFTASDKNCAIFRNRFYQICNSGNGIIFKNLVNDRYYIHGIALHYNRFRNCTVITTLYYTKVVAHYQFINHLLTKYDPEDCELPAYPRNGKWTAEDANKRPGDAAASSFVINFECKKGFKLSSSSNEFECGSIINLPSCQKLCPPLTFPSGATTYCHNKNGETIDCSEAVHDSVLTYTCPYDYKIPDGTNSTRTCERGSWGTPEPQCIPSLICGETVDNSTVLYISGGKDQQELKYPWIVAMYHASGGNYDYKCSGSLISERLIVTAAHCVTNDYYDVLPKEMFRIGVGKLYIGYNDSRDTHAQYSELSQILVPANYRGSVWHYFGDIALLVTKKAFKITPWVKPICFRNVDNLKLHDGDTAMVSGWGVNENEILSEKLKTLEIPYKNSTACIQELPRQWAEKFNTVDKICAGYYNQSKSVCRGDSGGGLVSLNLADKRYYLHGVVSLGHNKNGSCNNQQNALFTNVSFYYNFIYAELNKIENCILPPYPENGTWVVGKGREKPGDRVPFDTVLKISCDRGCILSSDVSELECHKAVLKMPTCLVSCPEVKFSPSTFSTCISPKGEQTNCAKAVDNIALFYICPNGTQGVTKCFDGSWEKAPECQVVDLDKHEESNKI